MIEREMTIKWVEGLKDPLGFICIDCSHDYDTMLIVKLYGIPLLYRTLKSLSPLISPR